MFHREIPFLRICIPLCAGIVAGLWFVPGKLFIVLSSTLILLLFPASLRFNKHQENLLFGLAFTLTMFLLGTILYNNEKSSLSSFENEETQIACILSDYPEEKPKSQMLTLKMLYRSEKVATIPLKGSIVIYVSKKENLPELIPGDRLVIRCVPAAIRNRGNPYEFNYKFYMENHGVKYSAFITADDILYRDNDAKRGLKHRALITRHRIIQMYSERGISDEMLPLVSALTLGEKTNLDQETKDYFIKAGIMHIMAVSGLHAMILSMFVLNALFFLRRRFNLLRIITAVSVIWCFAFITGLTPSVLRATLMFTFIQAGGLMKRQVNSINSVLASAFVLILARPSVIFDAGFLLSYSAVIFIIVFYRDIYLLIQPGNYITDRIWQSAAVTIAAQTGTLPLTIMLFNRFPVWFLITNLIIVPLSSLAIIIGCIIPLFYNIKAISMLAGFVLDRLTWLTQFLTMKAASLPLSNIGNIGMTVPECMLLSLSLFLFLIYFLKKHELPALWPASVILVYLLALTITDISVKRSNELIIYNTPGQSSIGIRTGKRMTVLSDTLVLHPDVLRHCSTLGINAEPILIRDNNLICAGDKKILVCSNPNSLIISNHNPDLLLLHGNTKSYASLPDYKGGIIILPSHTGRQPYAPEAYVHAIKKSGAFVSGLNPLQ